MGHHLEEGHVVPHEFSVLDERPDAREVAHQPWGLLVEAHPGAGTLVSTQPVQVDAYPRARQVNIIGLDDHADTLQITVIVDVGAHVLDAAPA